MGVHRLSDPERFHAVSWYGAAPWHSAALRHGLRVLRAAPRYEKNTEQTMTEAITPAAMAASETGMAKRVFLTPTAPK